MTPDTPGSQGASVRCDRCGGSLAFDGTTAHVACPFCGHVQAVPPGLLADLARYRSGIGELAARVAAHERAEHDHRLKEASNPFSVWALLVAFAPVLLAGGANAIVQLTGLLDEDAQSDLDAVVQGASGLWLVAGTFGWVWWRRAATARRASAAAGDALGSVTCPGCGAPNTFHAGRVVERCRWCGDALAPDAGVVDRGLDAARLHERRARLDRLRAERGVGPLIPPALDGVIDIGVLVLCALLSLAAGYFLPLVAIHGAPVSFFAAHPRLVTAAGWLLGVAGAIVAVAVVVWRVAKGNAWQLTHAQLAGRLGAARASPAEALRWANAYWAGPLDPDDLELSSVGAAFTATVDGFPVLVVIDAGPKRGGRTPRMSIWVAALLAGPASVDPGVRRRLDEHGFTPYASEGGIRASASDAVVKRLQRRPDDVLALASLPGLVTAHLRRHVAPAPAW